MDLISTIIIILLLLCIVVIVTLVAKRLLFVERVRTILSKKTQKVFLIKIHPSNEKKENVFEALLKTLHDVLPHHTYISLELVCSNQFMHFYVTAPIEYASLLTSQLYSQFPDVEIEETNDYASLLNPYLIEIANKGKTPFKTYKDGLEDILKGISAILSTTSQNEEIFLQLILSPNGSKFWEKGINHVWESITDHSEQNKINQETFRGKLIIGYAAQNSLVAKKKVTTVIRLLKQTKYPHNELKVKKFNFFSDIAVLWKSRTFEYGDIWTEAEIASIYHFPYKGSITSNVIHTDSKKAPAPDILPLQGDDISFFGETNYHNEFKKFGIKRIDRRRHMYVVGKTGSGKSRLLQLLLIADIQNNQGCCLIDPHGDLAQQVLTYVPKERIKDVVYIDPSDKDFPIGFNPLESTQDFETKQHLSTFFIAIFKKLFGYNWNPRMEHLVRYITLALLETSDSNILGISRMLTDTAFRQRVIKQIQDPVIKNFWTNEFPGWIEKYANEAVIPIMNKVGQFIANPMIRNMVGQNKNTLDFERFMDEGKIVIINLSKGKLGEENTAFLGSMFITKIQQAALSRSRIPEEARKDFYFYVDEFQNFATDAFSSILSEARKYHLNLTIAHQYIAQLPDDIKATAFGNVGSLVTFSVGGDDASYLGKEFSPIFTPDDLISLNTREMYIKLSVNGKLTPPFSARTIEIPSTSTNYTIEILEHSRITYGKNRIAVENEIQRWTSSVEFQSDNASETFPEPII